MAALLLTGGQVRRPFNWIHSLPTNLGGSGGDPVLKMVEWPTQADYDNDVVAGNLDHGAFVSETVPGFLASSYNDASAVLAALIALQGDYGGATEI